MAYHCRQLGFTVNVDSGFVENGRFAVMGWVGYAPGISRAARERAKNAALLAMIAGIEQGLLAGRAAGVRRMDVSVEGDPGLVEVFRNVMKRRRPRQLVKQARVRVPADH